MGWCRVHSAYIVVLVKGVGSIRAGGICRGWEHPLKATDNDDIRCDHHLMFAEIRNDDHAIEVCTHQHPLCGKGMS